MEQFEEMILTEDIAHEIHRATGLTVNVRIEEAPVCAGPGYEPPGFHGVGDVVETFHVFVKNHGMDISQGNWGDGPDYDQQHRDRTVQNAG